MELPHAKIRAEYTEQVKAIEAALKEATTVTVNTDELDIVQGKLNTLADTYQNNEAIGSARYKLYELQALVYYFTGNDDDAFEFIDYAVQMRGQTYLKAERLKEQLLAGTHKAQSRDVGSLTKEQQRKKLIGLEGWLALFIVGQFLALIFTIVRLFTDGTTSASDIQVLNDYQYGLGDSLQNLVNLENFAIFVFVGLIITTLVLLFQKRRVAKYFAIATLAYGALYGVIDYAIASSLFESSGLTALSSELRAFMSSYAGNVGRNVVAAAIWIPYFLVSKRVKATLTK